MAGGSQLWRTANQKVDQFIAYYFQAIGKFGDASAKAVFVLQPGKLPPPKHVAIAGPRGVRWTLGGQSRSRWAAGGVPPIACHRAPGLHVLSASHDWKRRLRTIGNGAGAARLCKSKH